jgi:hypothetical protein
MSHGDLSLVCLSDSPTVKTQTLIFGIIYTGNVKVIPTFRINFPNFPWQLLDAYRPAGFTCLMQPALACVGPVEARAVVGQPRVMTGTHNLNCSIAS